MIGDDTTGPDAQGSPNGITADSGEYHIALEHPEFPFEMGGRDVSTGRIVLEANDGASPTSSNLESSISSTTSTRTIVGHTIQRDVIVLELDENLPKVPSFVACGTDDIYANGASFDGTGTALPAGSSVPGLSTSYEISFGIKDVDSISVSNNSIRLGNADVDELSRVGNLPTGNTILKETQFNSLIFPLPDSPLKMLANVSYTIKSSKGGLTDSSGTVTIAAGGTDKFVHASGTDTVTLTPSQAEEAFIVVSKNNETGVGQADTGVKVSNGQSLSFTSADQVSRQISVTGGSAVIKCNTGQQINVHVTFTATRTAQAGSGKIKTLLAAKYTNNYTAAGGSTITDHLTHGQFLDATPTREVGTAIELPTSDVFNLVKVVDSGDLSTPVTNAMMIDTANNITESYSLDTGQTDNYYGHSSIKLKPGKVPPSGQIVVVFDRFTHEAEDGFFSTNSYNTNFGTTYNGGQNTFSYSDIPSYTSPITGETNRLSDVVDFRPIVRDNSGTDSYDVATNTSAILVSTIVTPDPDTTTTLDYEYFLPRIDKLVLTRDRKFEVIKGKSSSRPVVPPDDEDSMTLYTLRIPAYTFALTDIETRYIDNKRFTMRDIGKLEKRIERLEYFTSLSILEKETEAREITSDSAKDSLFNDTGSRFKSGILVDPFAGHSIGDVSSDDYNAAVHFSKKQLRPPFYYDNFRFKLNTSGSNNVVQTGDLVTMPFANTTFVDQPLQSHSKAGDPIQKPNPFNILNYIGNVKLDPASDTWFDQTSRPEVTTNVEGHHDNWTLGSGTRQGFGTQWDDWSVNWSGKQINPEPNTAVSNSGSTTVRTRSTKLLSQNKTKFGIQSDNPVETIVKTVGPKVVDMSVVPFVRSQTVTFTAKGLKPLSNVYVFVDGTDMSANTEPSKKLVLSAANGVFQEGEIIKDSANNQGVVRISSNTVSNAATIFITDISGNSSATLGSPVSSQNNRISNSSIGFAAANVVTGLTSGANGTISTITANSRGILTAGVSQMQTNDHGEISGDIDIPAGEFRTGDRLVRITDHANNELASTTTIAETLFKSKGVLQTRDNLIISTRELITRRESISTDEITRDTSSRQSGAVDYLNPQAQTFFVDANVFPLGVFLRNCTLFFATKDSNLPVTVQIRPVINGFPSASQIIPFSEVTLNPDMVVASFSNNPTGTVFSFESPVYLPTGEYAIVILSNSSEYMTYHGEVGENVVGTSRKITPQPFVGSYFIPSNGGEYKADPNKFLKFKLERCNFTGQLPGPGGANNFARFDSHANGANGNTANVNYQTFKVTTSTIEFSNTQMSLKFNSANTSGANVGFAEFNTDQNIVLANTRMMKMNSNGMFIINAVMSTTDSHVSPVIDIDRLSVITIENDIDDAVLAANDFTVTSRGSGYTNTAANGATATISSPNLGSNTATVNVHCEVTLTLSGTSSDHLQSGNSSYTVNTSTSGQFVVGEGIRTIVSTDAAGSAPGMSSISGSLTSGTGSFTPGNGTANRSGTNPSHLSNAAVGVITSQTFVGGNTSANTATITIKTSSNNFGVFSNGCFIVADSDAQETNMTNSGVSSPSKTFAVVSTVAGQVSNVMPWPAQSTSSLPSGTGYLTSPTVTISAPHSGTDTATAVVTGEDSASGGNINAKYISRRVTLEDGFDSKDLKVIINAYKPIESGIHVYYKVKSEEDPEDFDKKGYTLMTQETPSTVYSLNEEDTKEYLFKTTDESITYTSGNITYDTFKTFAIKIALTSNTASIVPKVRDMRAIALDV